MGKKRIIAETGAGQHGVATAAACAYLGLNLCYLYGQRRYQTASAECDADAPDGSESDCRG